MSSDICWLDKITIGNKFIFTDVYVKQVITHMNVGKTRWLFQESPVYRNLNYNVNM